jgi:hypothetical protein
MMNQPPMTKTQIALDMYRRRCWKRHKRVGSQARSCPQLEPDVRWTHHLIIPNVDELSALTRLTVDRGTGAGHRAVCSGDVRSPTPIPTQLHRQCVGVQARHDRAQGASTCARSRQRGLVPVCGGVSRLAHCAADITTVVRASLGPKRRDEHPRLLQRRTAPRSFDSDCKQETSIPPATHQFSPTIARRKPVNRNLMYRHHCLHPDDSPSAAAAPLLEGD